MILSDKTVSFGQAFLSERNTVFYGVKCPKRSFGHVHSTPIGVGVSERLGECCLSERE